MAKKDTSQAKRGEKARVFKLITDAAELNRKIAGTIVQSVSYHDNLHEQAVSVLNYTAASGRTELLNKFYSGLREAYQSAFRGYVTKYCGDYHGKDGGGKAWIGFLDYAKKTGWVVTKDRMPQRDALQARALEMLAADPFFNKDPKKEKSAFDDVALINAIQGLVRRVNSGKDEGTITADMQGKVLAFAKSMGALKEAA